jgi:glucosyl-3-phosphoglycerate phosphatase
MTLQGRIFIARHGETVFNAAARMQGDSMDTPLTRTGFAQADAMGKGLADWLGTKQSLHLWSSPSGRALQTLAIVAEHIGLDWHEAHHDARLQEINVGHWTGRTYAEIIAENGSDILDRDAGLFNIRPPGGEWYDEIAARLTSWMEETASMRGDRLVLMHGMSSRVLRGLLLGLDVDPLWKAPIAPSLPQGTMVMIGGGTEKIIKMGGGISHA